MLKVLEIIAIYSGIVGFLVFLYEHLTDDDQKRNHKQKLSRFLKRIQSMRSLELAQNDAGIILSWLNYIYGKPSKNRFFTRDFWLWRPVWVSILLAAVYLIPVIAFAEMMSDTSWDNIFTPWDDIIISGILYLFILLINAFLDLVSVNVSRIIFFKMSKSSRLRDIMMFIFFDFLIASLLYLSGPAWVSIVEDDYFSGFIMYIQFWELSRIDDKILVAVMFLSTLVPTIFHLLISVLFFVSKTVAQPLRVGIEKTIEYMISLPKGVTALFAFVGTIIISILAWIIGTLI